MATNLEQHFDPTSYEVVGFFTSTTQSMRAATDRLGLRPEELIGKTQYPPYEELKDGAPEMYAAKPDRVWITFNVVAHEAALYTSVPGFRRSTPAVLLWKKTAA